MERPADPLVLEWEQRRREAMLAGDATALAALLSDALVYVHSTATRDTKEDYLAKIRDRVLQYRQLQFTNLAVQSSEGVALVTGFMAATVLKDGQEKQVRSAFLTAWVPENGVWLLRAHQGTPLA